jgi:dUTP pyrophosphatase
MSDITVLLKKLREGVPDPVYGTAGAAGCDIHADEDLWLPVGENRLVSTGLCMQIPDGYECQIRPRSGLALKEGVIVFNSPSTIDSDYRGELKILLTHHGVPGHDKPFHVTRGMRIAQLVFAPVTRATFKTVDELDASARGMGGWGSTGTQAISRS